MSQFDPRSAVALAINTELDRQLAGQNVTVVIDPGPLADAVLNELDDPDRFPRIPDWTGEPRSIGGGSTPHDLHPQPQVTVDVQAAAHVTLTVQVSTDAERDDEFGEAVVPVADAEQWALAVLAACRAARD